MMIQVRAMNGHEGQEETPIMLRKLIAATFASLLVAAAAWAEPVTYVLSTPGVV
jgi:hypothetical protein